MRKLSLSILWLATAASGVACMIAGCATTESSVRSDSPQPTKAEALAAVVLKVVSSDPTIPPLHLDVTEEEFQEVLRHLSATAPSQKFVRADEGEPGPNEQRVAVVSIRTVNGAVGAGV